MAQGIKYDTKEELTNALIALIFPNNKKLITGAKAQQAVLDLAESLWDQGGFINVNVDDATAEYLEDKLVEGTGISLTVIDNAGTKTIEISSTGTDSDEFVKVQADDTTPEYLGDKLVAGSNITINVIDNAGVKTLEISAAGGMFTDELVKASATDTTSGFLDTKIVAGSGMNLTLLNPGADESFELSTDPITSAEEIERNTLIEWGDFNSHTSRYEIDDETFFYKIRANSNVRRRVSGICLGTGATGSVTQNIQVGIYDEVGTTILTPPLQPLVLGTGVQFYYLGFDDGGGTFEVILEPNTEYWLGVQFPNPGITAQLLAFDNFSLNSDNLRKQTGTATLPVTVGGTSTNSAPVLNLF